MRNISHFINVLFCVLFFFNLLFTQEEKIKNIQIFGSNNSSLKSIFLKGEIINVSFDELSYETNSYYYSIDHYDYEWNKSNILILCTYAYNSGKYAVVSNDRKSIPC